MEYRTLGKAGVKVSPLCLGMGVRGKLDEKRFVNTVHRAIDLGFNFIDCANNYNEGRSESILGEAIKGKRQDLVITSKVWSKIGPGPNDRGLSRFHILREVERTLKKLQTRGPYGLVRHPGTTSKLLLWFSQAAFYKRFWTVKILYGYMMWGFIYVMRAFTEERHLKKYPEYLAYMKKVKKRFIPGLF